MRITRSQIEDAIRALPALAHHYKTPMARFLTDQEGWVIEVEHLENDGARRLLALLSSGVPDGDSLRFDLDAPTGKASGRQYHLRGIRNGTYAKKVAVRDRRASNLF